MKSLVLSVKCEKAVLLNKVITASMATEDPMRIVDNGLPGKWAPSRGKAAFATSATTRVGADELGLLLRGGHNIDRDQSSIAPNRSGSAPPSMEGSFAAFGNNWRLPSINDHGSGSGYVPVGSLSTHEEELEDDRSPSGASGDRARSSRIVLVPGQNMLSFNGRHKSLVDLIQADFPRTPSPVFSQNHSSSQVEEPFHNEMQNLSLDSESVEASRKPISLSGVGSSGRTDVSSAEKDPSENPRKTLSPRKDKLTTKDAYFHSEFVSDDPVGSGASKSLHRVVEDYEKQDVAFDKQNEVQPQHTYSHHVAAGCHVSLSQNNVVPHGNAKSSSVEMQPILHAPPDSLPPVYATTAAYMSPENSVYANFSSSGLYPQYSGYAMGSSFFPTYLAGYPPHTGYPMHFNAHSGQSGSAVQNLNTFYDQHGLTMHPTFPVPDPLPLQYFQQTVQDPYGVSVQFSHLPSPRMISNQVDSFALRNDPATHSVSIPSVRELGVPSNSYVSSPTGLGFVPQFPASPLGSPVLPESPPVGGASFGRRYDFEFSQSYPRNAGSYSRWNRQMGTDGINENRKHSLLEELKASSARRIELSDILGRIVEFSIDQHGSRFIQQKLENCSVEEKESVFKEVLPHCSKLITDVFGNYVIQKFFEHGTCEQRRDLASQLSGQMLAFSLQMYGCRVIQKALEVVEVEQKTELVHELDGHVMRCIRDQNGNHVIQKCIECMPTEKIDFIISAFEGQVATLSTHPYGCRVVQRILEHCSNDLRCRSIVDEIVESAYDLAHDQYGNYVTQHVLERGEPLDRSQIIIKLREKIVQMSHHKYASNVVEKCLEFGDSAKRELLIEEILLQSEDNDNLLAMMKDQFANYVVQKILEISNGRQRETLLDRIQLHLVSLKKYTYGKHIVTRFEQLCGEDNDGTSDA